MEKNPVPRKKSESERIKQDLRRQISERKLLPETQLLSENRLAEQYSVGVYQARKAVKELVAEGFLYSRPKSGVFVAQKESLDTASVSAFYNFSVRTSERKPLRFMPAGWDPRKHRMWAEVAKLCKEVCGIEIELAAPDEGREYSQCWRENSDIFIATPHHIIEEDVRLSSILPFSRTFVESLPLSPAHIDAVEIGGNILGVPLFATHMIGMINNRLVSPGEQAALLAGAVSWPEFIAALIGFARNHPGVPPLNLDSIIDRKSVV